MVRGSLVTALMAALFVGCADKGGNSSTDDTNNSVNISGKVIDGYLSGSTVTVGGKTTNSDSNGSWSIEGVELTSSSYVTVTGGTDISTGEAYGGAPLKAFISAATTSGHISPLTTMVAEAKLADSTASLSTLESQIAQNLGLDTTLLKSDPVALLATSQANASKTIKAILQIQKFAEAYDAIESSLKTDSQIGLAALASQLKSDGVNLGTAIGTVKDNVSNNDAKEILDLVQIQLENIDTTSITNTSTLKTISKAVEIMTAEIEESLESNNTTAALNNAKFLSMNGLKFFTDKVAQNNALDASDYANSFFGSTDAKDDAVALYNKTKELADASDLTLAAILNDIATNGDAINVITQAKAGSNNPSFDMGTTLSDFNSTAEDAQNTTTSSIENGYYESVVAYNGVTDANFSVNLPQGTFYIIAEYASNEKSTQVSFGAIDSIKDENGNAPSDSNITSGNLRTNSSGVAKVTIKNNVAATKTYVIPVKAYVGTSDTMKASNIWVGAMNSDTDEITNTKNHTLALGDVTTNTGMVLTENEATHNWSFTTGSDDNGTYDLSVTTTNSNYKNPLQYFSVTFKEGTKTEFSQTTDDRSIQRNNIVLESDTSYRLELKTTGGEIPAAKSDALGYYTIKLIKQ